MLGYEQPKGDSEGLGSEIQQWNVEQKKPEKQYRIFQPFLPKVPVTLNFWALSYFGGLKDNVKQTTQVKNINNTTTTTTTNNNNNNNNINNNNDNNIDRP